MSRVATACNPALRPMSRVAAACDPALRPMSRVASSIFQKFHAEPCSSSLRCSKC